MTEEILQSIVSAEKQAADKREQALERAEAIELDAENRAAKIEKESLDSCKAYLDEARKAAQESAQKQYDEMIGVKSKEAREYCAGSLKKSETLVTEIVRRIVSGDR